MGTLQSPMIRLNPCFITASVIIPDGFVKLMINASGASSFTRSAIWHITGMVLWAFIKPPIPVVSWPSRPYFGGMVSSRILAGSLPTRIWVMT